MADPAFKTYADTYFITKKEHDRQLHLAIKTIGETLGDILKPRLDRVAELEAKIAAIEGTLAGMRQPGKVKP